MKHLKAMSPGWDVSPIPQLCLKMAHAVATAHGLHWANKAPKDLFSGWFARNPDSLPALCSVQQFRKFALVRGAASEGKKKLGELSRKRGWTEGGD